MTRPASRGYTNNCSNILLSRRKTNWTSRSNDHNPWRQSLPSATDKLLFSMTKIHWRRKGRILWSGCSEIRDWRWPITMKSKEWRLFRVVRTRLLSLWLPIASCLNLRRERSIGWSIGIKSIVTIMGKSRRRSRRETGLWIGKWGSFLKGGRVFFNLWRTRPTPNYTPTPNSTTYRRNCMNLKEKKPATRRYLPAKEVWPQQSAYPQAKICWTSAPHR